MFLFTNAIHLLPYTGAGSGMLRSLSEDMNVSFTNNDRTNEIVIIINRNTGNQVSEKSNQVEGKSNQVNGNLDTKLRHSDTDLGTDSDTFDKDSDTRLGYSDTDLDSILFLRNLDVNVYLPQNFSKNYKSCIFFKYMTKI